MAEIGTTKEIPAWDCERRRELERQGFITVQGTSQKYVMRCDFSNGLLEYSEWLRRSGYWGGDARAYRA